MNRFIVLSGCSSGGKSTLLSALEKQGYTVVPEVGREIVKEQLASGSDTLPWKKPKEFCELLISRSVEAYRAAKTLPAAKAHVIFFDRSFLDALAYYQSLDTSKAHAYDLLVKELCFDPIVFMVPPWEELFCHDAERKHSFADAVAEYERLLAFYPQHGYAIVEIPKVSVEERVQWVLTQVLSQ